MSTAALRIPDDIASMKRQEEALLASAEKLSRPNRAARARAKLANLAERLERVRPNAAAEADHAAEDTKPGLDYRTTPGGLQRRKWSREQGEVWVNLTNFEARVVSDVVEDDGVETRRALEIAASIRGRQHLFAIPAPEFAAMNWPLTKLGAEAAIHPTQGARDQTRYAIQVLSGEIPRRHVYTHTGWREIAGKHVYLHGGGALGAHGPLACIEVQLPEQLDRFILTCEASRLTDAVEASLAMRKVAPDRITIPLLGAAYRAVLGGAGWRKDEVGTWHPRGDCVGWVDSAGLYLEPEASYAAAAKMGDGVSVAG